jgi:RimJ/RimL family protein N-acetyltransferase
MVNPTDPIYRKDIQLKTGRLLIRSLSKEDVKQLRIIRSDPKNNESVGIVAPNITEDALKKGIPISIEMKCNQLLIIKDPPVFPPGPDRPNDLLLRWPPGLLIGSIDIRWPEAGFEESDIGGYIHHRFTRNGYAKEAFAAVFDYALGDLQRPAVYLETVAANAGFRKMMKGLGLEALEKHAVLAMPTVTYSFGKARWEQAKREMGRS